jgi:hypothetical protein
MVRNLFSIGGRTGHELFKLLEDLKILSYLFSKGFYDIIPGEKK